MAKDIPYPPSNPVWRHLSTMRSSPLTLLPRDREDHLFTDATILHGTTIFHIHTIVVASISPVLDRALRGNFKVRLATRSTPLGFASQALTINTHDQEATTHEIDLSAEPVDALELMLDFIYSGDYDLRHDTRLPTHVRLYIMAEKYNIRPLMQATSEKLTEQLGDAVGVDRRGLIPVANGVKLKPWRDDEIIEAVRLLWYTPAPPHRAIREPILTAAVRRKDWLLDNDGFRDMIRGGTDFALWFLLGYIPWVEMSGVGAWKAGD